MKILVIGSGGREHALAWKLSQSPRATAIYCAPGNGGTADFATNVPISADDFDGLADFAAKEGIGLTVVGPDDALAGGVVDRFEARGLRVFGPRQSAARLESSKIFAREFMRAHGIPSPRWAEFDRFEDALAALPSTPFPAVVKADGLALGKGVIICPDRASAEAALHGMMRDRLFGKAGERVLIEECLFGRECSVHALVDGKSFRMFPAAQDHKRVGEGDTGPNTGGMGTFSPSDAVDAALEARIAREVLEPFLKGLCDEDLPFRGMLFPGLMLTADGPRVLEFNCRFGDPETQVLMARMRGDLVDLLEAVIDGRLAEAKLDWDPRPAVCVVLASRGYPGNYEKGKVISGLEDLRGERDLMVFHAGTKRDGANLVTSGGRVLGVTALGDTFAAARDRAYAAARAIRFDGAFCRGDIAAHA